LFCRVEEKEEDTDIGGEVGKDLVDEVVQLVGAPSAVRADFGGALVTGRGGAGYTTGVATFSGGGAI
jgi:hypothetical protein